jgi:hypothetical protein
MVGPSTDTNTALIDIEQANIGREKNYQERTPEPGA